MGELFNGDVSIHDFRMVNGTTHTNVIFDIVIPHRFRFTEAKVIEMAKENILAMDEGQYRAVVKVDHSYIG